ncbi:hypothetical protein K438DRAFT_1770199 [Mycena galopus ATCC 62051]|nr:hypothetical protein K438DRAFT_1770199 [Mycena galopus ATCC 62051]
MSRADHEIASNRVQRIYGFMLGKAPGYVDCATVLFRSIRRTHITHPLCRDEIWFLSRVTTPSAECKIRDTQVKSLFKVQKRQNREFVQIHLGGFLGMWSWVAPALGGFPKHTVPLVSLCLILGLGRTWIRCFLVNVRIWQGMVDPKSRLRDFKHQVVATLLSRRTSKIIVTFALHQFSTGVG